MKTVVNCRCGSAFNAPASLVGQVVKCPVCNQAMRVPEANGAMGGAAAPPGLAEDGDELSSGFGTSSAAQPTAGGSSPAQPPNATGLGMRRRSAGDDAVRIKTELCPRCQAVHVEAGRLCTSCLYEMHTGDRAGRRGRFKFTLGLGVSAAVLLLAAGIGAYLVLKTFRPAPAAPPSSPVVQGQTPSNPPAIGDSGVRPVNVTPAPDAGEIDPTPWAAADDAGSPGARYEAITSTRIQTSWDPVTGAQRFTVHLLPAASGDRLNMGTRVSLYRAASETGPFQPVDRATPSEIEPGTGALVFKVADSGAIEAGLNRAYYRLAGTDDAGLRLFDTPPAAFAVIPPPRIEAGRLKWAPAGPEAEGLVAMQCAVAVAAPGWERVALANLKLAGPVDIRLPGAASGLPVRAMVTAAVPTGVDIPSGGTGQWQSSVRTLAVGSAADAARAVVGIAPTWNHGSLGYELIPGPEAFAGVSEADGPAGRRLSFRLANQSALQHLSLGEAPGPTLLSATPFEDAIHLSWQGLGLDGAAARFQQPVSIAIFRTASGGSRELIAAVPLDHTSFTDTRVKPGELYGYDVVLTSANDPRVAAPLIASAWIAGHGEIPVVIPVTPGTTTPRTVMAEPGLTELRLSLAQAELCYPGTDRPALAVMEAIRDAVREAEGVSLIERGALLRAMSARENLFAQPAPFPNQGMRTRPRLRPRLGGRFGPNRAAPAALSPPPPAVEPAAVELAAATDVWPGGPAHIRLLVTDTVTPQGPALQLWVDELVAGEQVRTCIQPGAGADPTAFVEAVMQLVEARRRRPAPDAAGAPQPPAAEAQPSPPSSIVLAPLLPIDQMRRFYGSADLGRTLVEYVKRSGSAAPVTPLNISGDALTQAGAVLLFGRTWNNDDLTPGMTIHAIAGGSGVLLDTFREPRIDDGTPARFAQWCQTLRISDEASARLASLGRRPSPLLETERSLEPRHPVLLELMGTATSRSSQPTRWSSPVTLGATVTLAMGLPLPEALQPFEAAALRDSSDPLAQVRPYIARAAPPTFDQWTGDYARYLEADFQAFCEGLKTAAATVRDAGGAVAPRLIIRGEERFTGSSTLDGGIRVTNNPAIINVRGFLTVGGSGQPMVRYRTALDETFQRQPWTAYHAWKQVPRGIAEPFLKGVLLGVENDSYGRIDLNFDLAPPLHQFAAAALLAEMGDSAGAGFRRKAVEVASQTLREVIEHNPQSLTPRQAMYVCRALLILVFENDANIIQMLRDPRRLDFYIQPEPGQAADTLRLLVDRVGPTAWQWAAHQPAMDWNAFLWRSTQEMRLITDAMPNALPRDLYAHVRAALQQQPGG